MWLSHHQEYILLESAWDRVAITAFCSIVVSTLLILERHEEAKPSYAFDYKVNQVITVSASDVFIRTNKTKGLQIVLFQINQIHEYFFFFLFSHFDLKNHKKHTWLVELGFSFSNSKTEWTNFWYAWMYTTNYLIIQ